MCRAGSSFTARTARIWVMMSGISISAAVCAEPARVTLVDQRGVPVKLDAAPERIVTIPMPAASMIAAIDQSASRLVGMHPNSLTAIDGEVLGSIFPELVKVRTDIIHGGQFVPNIETLMALRPDLVVQWADQPRDVIGAIERAGLRVYGMRFGSQAELEVWIEHFGTLVGARERAQALVDYHRMIRSELENRLGSIEAGQRPSVLSFQRFQRGLRPSGSGSYADFTIRLAGGRNAAEELPGTAADVSFEQVLAWDPDIILLGGFDDAVPADLYRDPRWSALRAVRERRVYKWPLGGYRWDPPSHESPLSWIWLHSLLHPEASQRDLRAEIRDFFKLIYDHALSDSEIDRILRFEANSGGLHHDQFTRR